MKVGPILLELAALIVAGSFPAEAEDAERLFVGQRKLVSAEGRVSFCALTAETQTLQLRLVGNVISNMAGTCRAAVNLDGTFGGQCNLSNVVLYPRGRITGSTITLHTRNVGTTSTCEYDTVLKETK